MKAIFLLERIINFKNLVVFKISLLILMGILILFILCQNLHNMFSRNKMGMDMFDDFNYGNPMFKENPFVIDYIGYSLLFFSSDNTYILVSYRETSSIAIFDLETLESKGRLYDKSSVESLLQWYNSSDKINYLIISGYNMIEVINPFNKNDAYYSFKNQDSLKGSNYTHSIMYNFKDNNDYLLTYNRNTINILNLTLKTVISSIKINNEIYSISPWNEKYLLLCQGKSFSENQFTKISIVHIDSRKIITDIYISDKKVIKGSIKRLIVNNKYENSFAINLKLLFNIGFTFLIKIHLLEYNIFTLIKNIKVIQYVNY
jgi:hypothetical protein